MPGCETWDVVRVPFPYIERPVLQHRPALVVAPADVAGAYGLLWVAMVTSATHRHWPGDVVVSDLREAGLPIASIVRPAKLATIEAGIAEWIGRLPVPDRAGVSRYLNARLRMALNG
jgi:mRNA interferase MazF